jgi:hypothetical protein
MDAADRQHGRRSNGKRGLGPGREPEKRHSGGDAAVVGTSKYEGGVDPKREEYTDSGQEVRKGERQSHDVDGREGGRGEREQCSVRRL